MSASRSPAGVTAVLALSWTSRDTLVQSLEQGMESRLVFTARLYDRRAGFLGIVRDRLIGQATVARRAWRDVLARQYLLREDGAEDRAYPTAAALIDAFFSVPALSFAVPASAHPVVAARAHLEPLLLKPPLTLVTLVGGAAVVETGWVRSAPAGAAPAREAAPAGAGGRP